MKLLRALFLPLFLSVLFAGCGQKYDPDELIKDFLSSDITASEKAQAGLVEVGEPMVDQLISLLREKTVRNRHLQIAEIFYEMKQKETLKDFRANKVAGVLGDVLRDKETNQETKLRISDILGDFESSTAVRPLIAVLGTDDDVTNISIQSLTKLGQLSVGPLVKERENPDTRESKQAQVLKALEQLSESIAEDLKSEEEEERRKAINLLGQITNDAARNAVAGVMGDAIAKNRLAAVQVLKTEPNEIERELLLKAASDEDEGVAIEAAVGLAAAEDANASDQLLRGIKFSDAKHRTRAIQALQELNEAKAGDDLSKALKDDNLKVRRAAAAALEALGGGSGKVAMLEAIDLEDQDSRVRLICSRALGKMGEQKGVQKLISLINHTDSSIRIPAIHALGEVGQPAVKALLVKLFPTEDLALQTGACQALGHIGATEAVKPLLEVLRRPIKEEIKLKEEEEDEETLKVAPKEVHIAALRALTEIGAEETIEAAIPLLKAKDEKVRWNAEWSLARFGGKSAEALNRKLEDESLAVSAARVLGAIGSSESVEPLSTLLENKNIDARIQAAASLARLVSTGLTLRPETLRSLERIALEIQDPDNSERSVKLKEACLKVIEHAGGKSSLPALAELLVTEDDTVLRFRTVLATWKVLKRTTKTAGEEPSEIDLLSRIVQNDQDFTSGIQRVERLQRQAALRLGEIGHLKAVPTIEAVLRSTKPGDALHDAASVAYLRITGKKFEVQE